MPGCGASWVGCSPAPDHPSLGRSAWARYPLAAGAGGVSVGTRHQPQGARSCALALRAVGAARGHPREGGASCLGVGRPGLGAQPRPTGPRRGVQSGPATHWPQVRGLWAWATRHQARSLRSRVLALRAVGAARGRPGGGVSCLNVGRAGLGVPPGPDRPSWGRAAGALYPLAPVAMCGRGGLTVRGTFSRAVVCPVLCALRGFAAPGGCCRLPPVLVPWLWPAPCHCGVPCGPALVRRASSCPVALGAPVGFTDPGAVTPGFTGRLTGARGGRPRTRLFVPAAGPCRSRGAGLAPRRACWGPPDAFLPGRFLRLRSWAACSAVVWRVWTRSLTRPVYRTVRLSTGDSASAPGLFRVDADSPPFESEDATPGFRTCVLVRALLGRVGRAGLPGTFLCASPFLLAVLSFGPLRAGALRASVFFPHFSFSPARPGCLRLFVLPSPGCCGPWRSSFAPPPSAPPLFVSFLVFFPRPLVSGFPLFLALGALCLCAL